MVITYGVHLRSPYIDYQSAQIYPDLRFILVSNSRALQGYSTKNFSKPVNHPTQVNKIKTTKNSATIYSISSDEENQQESRPNSNPTNCHSSNLSHNILHQDEISEPDSNQFYNEEPSFITNRNDDNIENCHEVNVP